MSVRSPLQMIVTLVIAKWMCTGLFMIVLSGVSGGCAAKCPQFLVTYRCVCVCVWGGGGQTYNKRYLMWSAQ